MLGNKKQRGRSQVENIQRPPNENWSYTDINSSYITIFFVAFEKSPKNTLIENTPAFAITKWQQNCDHACLDKFRDGDIIETGYIEKKSNSAAAGLTCKSLPSTTLMAAMDSFKPQAMHEGGRESTQLRHGYIF